MLEHTKLDRVEKVIWFGDADPEVRSEMQDPKSESSRLAAASAVVHSRFYELVDKELLQSDMTDEEREFEEITDRWRRRSAAARNATEDTGCHTVVRRYFDGAEQLEPGITDQNSRQRVASEEYGGSLVARGATSFRRRIDWPRSARWAFAVAALLAIVGSIAAASFYNGRNQAQNERDQAQNEREQTQAAKKEWRDADLEIMYKDRGQRAEDEVAVLRSLQAALEKGEMATALSTIKTRLEKLKPLTLRHPVFPRDKSSFIKDVTFDDTRAIPQVAIGQQFKKIWRIKNAGSVSWQSRFLERQGDPAGKGQLVSAKRVSIPDTEPGNEVDVTVDLEAPETPGLCYAEWKMVDANGNYLLPGRWPLSVTVNVVKTVLPGR